MFQDLLGMEPVKPVNSSLDYKCGCFSKAETFNPQKEELLPLTKASYNIDIFNGLTEVTLVQQYLNPTEKMMEIYYKFPISPDVCLHRFTATFANKRLYGKVKEKQEAKKEYKQAVSEGKKAAYGEVDPDSKDMMILQIGNIEPQEKVEIQIIYIEELTLSVNTFYRFSLPIKNSPRYFNSFPNNSFENSFRNTIKLSGYDFRWDFSLKLRSSKKIIYHESQSHKTQLIDKNDTGTEITLSFAKEHASLNRDFVFNYTTEEFELPSYTLGRTDAGSSVMASFIPKFCELGLEDAKVQALKDESYETDLDAARGEYVFLLDRSGSMGGSRINKAKEALIMFLRSLPVNSCFNIVSFGSTFSKLKSESLPNNNKTIQQTIREVEKMTANYGGTEIQRPLQAILREPVIPGYPKQIFLLTDGDVSNTDSVIEVVSQNIKYARVHGIGIGSGASRALVVGCAKKGKGYHTFIDDYQNPSEKIIQLLNDSLTPVIDRVNISYDQKYVESIVPNPHSMPYILKNQVANFYLTFRGQLEQPTTITLEYRDSRNNHPYKSTLEVLPDSPSQSCIDKMAAFKTISALEESQQRNGNTEDYLYYVKKINKKEAIIDKSVKHQILSKHTAFICVEEELVDGKYQEIKDKEKLSVEINSEETRKNKVRVEGDMMFRNLMGLGGDAQTSSSNFSGFFGSSPPPPPGCAPQSNILFGSTQQSQQSQTYGAGLGFGSSAAIHSMPQSNLRLGGWSGGSVPQSTSLFSASSNNTFGMKSPPPPGNFNMQSQPQQKSSLFGEMNIKAPNIPPPPPPPLEQDNLLDLMDIEEKCDDIFEQLHQPATKKKQVPKKKEQDFDLMEAEEELNQPEPSKPAFQPKTQNLTVKEIVSQQSYQGSWSNINIIAWVIGVEVAEQIRGKSDEVAIITYLLWKWLEKYHSGAEFMLIRKKAHSWLKKQTGFSEYPQKYDSFVK